MIAEQAEQRGGADEAELLPHRGEDEVGVLLGHVARAGSACPGTGPCRCTPPEPIAILHCARLYSADDAVDRSTFGRLVLVDERREPVLLVDPSRPDCSTATIAIDGDDGRASTSCRGRAPASDEQHQRDGGGDERGAEVGLQHARAPWGARRRRAARRSGRPSISPRNCEANQAKPMIRPSLANSDGCSWNGPSWNQPCVPFWREPSGDRHEHRAAGSTRRR